MSFIENGPEKRDAWTRAQRKRVADVPADALRSACVVIVISIWLAACDHKAQSRAEAKQLLELVTLLQSQPALALRQRALDQLQALPLHEAAHDTARKLCHTAHAGLLRAETEQAMARQALESAGNAHELPAARRQEISEMIARSTQGLETAQKRFPACEKAIEGLIAEAR